MGIMHFARSVVYWTMWLEFFHKGQPKPKATSDNTVSQNATKIISNDKVCVEYRPKQKTSSESNQDSFAENNKVKDSNISIKNNRNDTTEKDKIHGDMQPHEPELKAGLMVDSQERTTTRSPSTKLYGPSTSQEIQIHKHLVKAGLMDDTHVGNHTPNPSDQPQVREVSSQPENQF